MREPTTARAGVRSVAVRVQLRCAHAWHKSFCCQKQTQTHTLRPAAPACAGAAMAGRNLNGCKRRRESGPRAARRPHDGRALAAPPHTHDHTSDGP